MADNRDEQQHSPPKSSSIGGDRDKKKRKAFITSSSRSPNSRMGSPITSSSRMGSPNREIEPVPPIFHQKILDDIRPRHDPVFLFEKDLSHADFFGGTKLTIRKIDRLINFLREEDVAKLDNVGYLTVVTREALSATRRHFNLHLTMGDKNPDLIRFGNAWKKILDEYGLMVSDSVQGWGYRHHRQLRMALKITKKKTSGSASDHNNEDDDQEPDPPVFHHTILEEIGNDDPVFLFKKEISLSDLNRSLKRLRIGLIKYKDKVVGFLRQDEKRKVEDKDVVSVITRDAELGGDEYTLHLATDDIGDVLLKHEWPKFAKANNLKYGDIVHGWGYRSMGNDEFRLALTIIRKGKPN